MRSILAALDGSPESIAALEQAAEWANRLDAELRVVTVQDQRRFVTYPTYSDSEGYVPRPIPLSGAALDKAEAEAAQEAAELRTVYERTVKDRPVRGTLRVVRGSVEQILIREAHGVDLVVLGKRGRNLSPSGGDAGPTTETLIHEALRPVLVVPRSPVGNGTMLVPFDGSTGAQRVIVPGLRMAAAAKAKLVALTVAESRERGESIQAPLRDYVRAYGMPAEFRIVEAHETERSAARAILAAAEDLKAGLIMMGAFSVSPFKEFFLGSVTREVLGHARCPVLMMT